MASLRAVLAQSTLEGNAVRNRPLRLDDIEMVRVWRNSKEVARWHISQDEISSEQQRRWFDALESRPDRDQVWIIETLDERPIGVINVKDMDRVHRTGEVGLYIGELEDRGNIHAMEAFYLLLVHCFDGLGLNKCLSHYLTENTVAKRMNTHFGFVEEGLLREHVFYGGEFHDYVVAGLLEDEFRASSGAAFFAKRRA